MKYFGFIICLLTIFAACNASEEEASSETVSSHPGTIISEIERVEEQPEEVPIEPIELTNVDEKNLYDLLLAIEDRENISEELQQYLESRFDFMEGGYMGMKLYPLSKEQLYIIIRGSLGASELNSYTGYFIALIDKDRGVLSTQEFIFDNFERSESNYQVYANQLIVADIDSAIYRSSAKFARGLEYERKVTRRTVYYVTNNAIKILEKSDKATLRQARNHLYAHKGYQFKSEDLQNHFKQYDWYQPQHSNAEGLLLAAEQEVANYILKLEQQS